MEMNLVPIYGTHEIIALPQSKRENVFIHGHLRGPHQKREFFKMRFFIAAVVAFAMMTLDFESFKFNYALQGATRGAFTIATGHAAEQDKVEPTEPSIRIEAA